MADPAAEPPPTRPWVPAAEAPPPRPVYRPITNLTAWLLGLLSAEVLLSTAELSLAALGWRMYAALLTTPERVVPGLLPRYGWVVIVVTGVSIVVLLLTAVLFLVWFRRAYRNALYFDTGGRARFKPGWAVGAWFVPFLNLVRPKQIADDIWRTSNPQRPVTDHRWDEEAPSRLVMIWWVAYVVGYVLDRGLSGVIARGTTLPELLNAERVSVVLAIAEIISALLAIAFVAGVRRRQAQRIRALSEYVPETPAAVGGTPE